MDWFRFITNIINKIPVERILFPPRDNVKSLEEFAATMTAPVAQKEAPLEQKTAPTTTITQEPETAPKQETVATACVPCAVGHFSTSAGLLKEAARFKGEGITSNEILNRIAMALEEQNTLERVDLRPELIQSLPPWEKELAEEALLQSRQLRHNLENLRSIEQLGKTTADSETTYKKLFREWFKQRFAHLGPAKAQIIAEEVGKLSPEDKDRVLKGPEELNNEVRNLRLEGE